ncbi:solute carrier family 22 member 20-like [Dermacentor albipictus]|uniref:solute carrier family 22 member 20-like n=1 Tax=Dermacentor albipictus TaxID=60249 RepID=UPI0031FC1DA2
MAEQPRWQEPRRELLGFEVNRAQGDKEPKCDLPFGVGAFQWLVLFSLSVGCCVYAMHNVSFLMTAVVMDHWCQRPARFLNISVAEWKSLAIPVDENGNYSRCTMRHPPENGSSAVIIACTSWEYDMDAYGNNIVSEWNLVCGRRWLLNLAGFIYAAASAVSLPVSGALADRLGRKIVVFIAVPVVGVAGAASSLPTNFHSFVAVRTLVSASTSALIPPLISLLYEASPKEKMPFYSILPWLFSFLLVRVAFMAAVRIRGGWAVSQLVLMVPTCLLMLLYYTVDDSMEWHLAHGHAKHAKRAALRAARCNGVPWGRCRESFARLLSSRSADTFTKKAGVWDLFSSCFRTRTFLLAYSWAAATCCYSALVFNDGVPVSHAVTATGVVASAVAVGVAALCIPRFGYIRVLSTSGLVFSATSAILTSMYNDQETLTIDVLVVAMRMAGNVAMLFLFSPGIYAYPVTLHSSGIGFGFACSRLGGILYQMAQWHPVGRRAHVLLTLAAILMALFAVAMVFLPKEANWKLKCQTVACASVAALTGDDLRRAMRETLLPLPKTASAH